MVIRSYRIAAGTEMTPQLLADFIAYHDRQVKDRYLPLQRAYENKLDIGKRIKPSNFKPNNILKVGFARYMVDAFAGYMTGIQPAFQDENGGEFLGFFARYAGLPGLTAELARQADIFGKAYLMAFVDGQGEVSAAVTTPLDSFIVYDEGISRDPLYFIHYYKDWTGIRRGTISDSESIWEFVIDPSVRYVDEEPRPHGFAGVPAVRFSENTSDIGLYEEQLDLIKGYSRALSYELDDIQSFAQAILKVLGAQLSEEDKQDLRETQIINVPGAYSGQEVVVDFLSKPDGNATQENFLNRVERLIFSTAMVADISSENFGTQSGIALLYKLLSMSNLAAAKEALFKKAFDEFFRLVCSCPVTGEAEDAWLSYKVVFSRNLPESLLEQAETAAKLAGITSRETQLSAMPAIVSDVQAELGRIRAEEQDAWAGGFPDERTDT